MKKIIKFLVPPVIFGFVVAFVISYEDDRLSVEETDNYKIFLKAKQAYEDYCSYNNSEPCDFSFLPKQMLSGNGRPVYPLEVDVYDGEIDLCCELRMIPGTTPSVGNYLFPPYGPCKILVCKLKKNDAAPQGSDTNLSKTER